MERDYKRVKKLDKLVNCGVCGTNYRMFEGRIYHSNRDEGMVDRPESYVQSCTKCGYDPKYENDIYFVLAENIKVTFTKNNGMEFNEKELSKLVTQEAWRLFTKKNNSEF